MNQKFKDDLRDFFNIAVGAAAVGAEKTMEVAEKLKVRGKKEWEDSAPKREELRARIEAYKEQFREKMKKDKDSSLTLDEILNNLDKFTEAELEKLREILNNIGKE